MSLSCIAANIVYIVVSLPFILWTIGDDQAESATRDVQTHKYSVNHGNSKYKDIYTSRLDREHFMSNFHTM
jgi:hypothetical protein